MRERIKHLCKQKGISMNMAEIEIGIARGYISKLDKSNPNAKTLQKIADYFNVSVEYLMTGEEARIPAPVFEEDHIKLIAMYSKLNKEQKEAVFNLLRSFGTAN